MQRSFILTAYQDHHRYDHESKEIKTVSNQAELDNLLADGWHIVSTTPMGGAGGASTSLGGQSGMNDFRQFAAFACLLILNRGRE